jgi:hypothetical protein
VLLIAATGLLCLHRRHGAGGERAGSDAAGRSAAPRGTGHGGSSRLVPPAGGCRWVALLVDYQGCSTYLMPTISAESFSDLADIKRAERGGSLSSHARR